MLNPILNSLALGLGDLNILSTEVMDIPLDNSPPINHGKERMYLLKQNHQGILLVRMFYGPGGPYALYAGKDASRTLAKMSFEEKDLTGGISGLGPFDALQDWEYKFTSKYVKVGTVEKLVPVGEGEAAGEPSESTACDIDAAKPS